MGRLELSDFIQLIRAKVDILKLKADSYEWQCTVPVDVKAELEKTLKEIDGALAIGADLPPDDVCCCGAMMKDHESILDCGHVPKSMLAYHLESEARPKSSSRTQPRQEGE